MTTELAKGVLVAGRYRLEALIGQGGMGQVWAATHAVTLRKVALKFLRGPSHLQPEMRKRFLREARAASAVSHPNVVEIRDFFELDDETPVMVMDLLVGETLGQRMAREGAMPLRAVANVLSPVVSAVGTAHALGIVHRDLKPDNVFLAKKANGDMDVRVLDFGIAKLTAAHDATADDLGALTDTGTMLGTPCYMSPEQGFGERDIDHRADIWALGVMLYEMLSGTRPVDGDNMGQVLKRLITEGITPLEVLVPELPSDVTVLVGRALSRDRADRPTDLREVQDVLTRHGGESVPTFGAAVTERPLLDSGPRPETPGRAPMNDGKEITDPEGETHAAESVPRLDTAGAQSLSVRGTRRRGTSFAVVAAVIAIAGLAVVRGTRQAGPTTVAPASAGGTEAALRATVAPLAVPALPAASGTPPGAASAAAATPPAPRAVSAGSPPMKDQGSVLPRSSATTADSRASHAISAAHPAASSVAAPAPSSAPSRPPIPSKRGGLVDEPPF